MIELIVFIYVSSFIYNNIIFNSDNSNNFMLIASIQSEDDFMYFLLLPFMSIIFTFFWLYNID